MKGHRICCYGYIMKREETHVRLFRTERIFVDEKVEVGKKRWMECVKRGQFFLLDVSAILTSFLLSFTQAIHSTLNPYSYSKYDAYQAFY